MLFSFYLQSLQADSASWDLLRAKRASYDSFPNDFLQNTIIWAFCFTIGRTQFGQNPIYIHTYERIWCQYARDARPLRCCSWWWTHSVPASHKNPQPPLLRNRRRRTETSSLRITTLWNNVHWFVLFWTWPQRSLDKITQAISQAWARVAFCLNFPTFSKVIFN